MAAAADKAFTGYRPLDKARREIRLLRLKAGYGEDTVRCEITHASLDDAALASYETISYVWGDPSIRTIIEIDGSRVLEPKTAAAALTRMRLEDEDRTLWIDAICIDQSNKPERSHQVNMMAEIYTRGTRCLAYLRSESRNQGESAASAIRVLRKHAMAEANVLDLTVHGAGSKDGQLGPLIVECAKDAIDAFCDVLKGPWFRRLWVLQEVTLSTCTLLHLEGATIELSHVLQVIHYLLLDQYREVGDCERIVTAPHARSLSYMAWLRRKASSKPMSLHNLLLVGAFYDVTDVRDRVYAVLGIYQRGRGAAELPQCLIPDYLKNSHEVLREATYHAIKESQSLHLWHVQQCKPDDSPTSGISSWVPLLRSAYSSEERPMSFAVPTDTYGADGSRLHLQDCLDRAGTVLEVEGFILDTVCARTDSLRFSDFDLQGLHFLQGAVDLFNGRVQAPILDLQDLQRTLVAGEQKQTYGERPLDALMARLSSEEEATMREFPHDPDTLLPRPSEIEIYAYDLRQFCTNRCVFVTKAGYVGLGPEYMQEGDIVAILSRGLWPFALRRCDLGKEQYQLLSSCYVHGVMQGEAAERHAEQDLPWRSFDIV